jgi:tRNA-Thr(GGU) m(6)t(6)A37 methyltransferase TsaA
LDPIGVFRCQAKELYQCPNQPRADQGEGGLIELFPHKNFEQALEGLERFSHVWVIFMFDQAKNWKPKILPPRSDKKVGCLASRSPHRPNPIGMSVLELKSVSGRKIEVGHHDLVDGTPILDIKPYLPSNDSIPHANGGWTEDVDDLIQHEVSLSSVAKDQLDWLRSQGLELLDLARLTLELYPKPRTGRRNRQLENDHFELSCKTWRLIYTLSGQKVTVLEVRSGYALEFLDGRKASKWDDVPLHVAFLRTFDL